MCMSPHGPDLASFEAATRVDTQVPQRLPQTTMAFMFEMNLVPRVMVSALESQFRELDYQKCWAGLRKAGTAKRAAESVTGEAVQNNGKLHKHEITAEASISTG